MKAFFFSERQKEKQGFRDVYAMTGWHGLQIRAVEVFAMYMP